MAANFAPEISFVIPQTRNHQSRQRPLHRRFLCKYPLCTATFHRYFHYSVHLEKVHECLRCGRCFANKILHDCGNQRGRGGNRSPDNIGLFQDFNPRSFVTVEIAHGGATIKLKKNLSEITVDIEVVLSMNRDDMKYILSQILNHQQGIKISITLGTTLERVSDGFILNRQLIGPFIPITHPDFIVNKLQESFNYLKSTLTLYEADGSGWRVKNINFVEMRTVQFKPRMRRGGLIGGQYIPTPGWLSRKGLINIKSTENNCFMLCVLAKVYMEQVRLWNHPELTFIEMNEAQRKQIRRIYENPTTWECIVESWNPPVIDFQGFQGMVDVKNIDLFELMNPGISINVYMVNSTTLYPTRITQNLRKKHVDLLPLQGKKESYHFILIPDLGKFYGRQGYRKTDVCRVCLLPVSSNTSRHLEICQALHKEKRIALPKNKTHSFDKYFMHMDINFKIVFQLHYCTSPIHDENRSGLVLKYTNSKANQTVAGFTIVMLDPKWTINHEETYFGLDCMEHFFSAINDLSAYAIQTVRNTYIPFSKRPEFENYKRLAKVCPLCHQDFNDSDRKPAFNHQHITGELYSIICVPCNILVVKKPVVVLSHNFSEVDAFTILKNSHESVLNEMEVHPYSSKKITSIIWKQNIRFVDSKEHLHSDLGAIINGLQDEITTQGADTLFRLVHKRFGSQIEFLSFTQPIVFPVDIDFRSEIHSTSFPLIETFNTDCNMTAYENSKRLFSIYKCTSMIEYAKLYCRLTTLQLCDVLHYYTKWSIKSFNLSPLHCPSISSFAMEAAFAFSGAKVEHIYNPETLKWILNGIKAGMSFSTVQIAQSSNEYIGNHETSKRRSHIIELDLNGPYAAGAAMNLCVGEYTWLDEESINTFNVTNLEDEGDYAYIIEVDMHCPEYLHNVHNQLPPGIEKRKVNFSELSPIQKQKVGRLRDVKIYPFTEEKLILDLNKKKNYVVYHKLLKLYVKAGMQITKIHKVLRFKSSPYLKTFVSYVMSLRKNAQLAGNTFIKNACKLMLNSIYGKFLSNTGNRHLIQVCTSKIQCNFYAAKPSFADITVLSDDCSLVHLNQGTVYHPYNAINAFIILENCRHMVYSGWYKFQEHFQSDIKLLAGETDSLMLQIFDPECNFIEKMRQLSSFVDFSSLPPTHPLFNDSQLCELGKWKVVSLNISEYVCLKSKVFSYTCICDMCKTPFTEGCQYCEYYIVSKLGAAGIKKHKQKLLSHQFFRQLVLSGEPEYAYSKDMQFCLNSLDTRRYFSSNPEESLAFGHYLIPDGDEDSEISTAVAIDDDSGCTELQRKDPANPRHD